MLDPETTAFVESGCALIVGTVTPDGEPHAARGWGATVIDRGGEFRLLLADNDPEILGDLADTGRIAITAANVVTFSSRQFKGELIGSIEPANDADLERMDAYCDAFFADITATDGTPRQYLERMIPPGFVACHVRVAEQYDQTPGPRAGSAVEVEAT